MQWRSPEPAVVLLVLALVEALVWVLLGGAGERPAARESGSRAGTPGADTAKPEADPAEKESSPPRTELRAGVDPSGAPARPEAVRRRRGSSTARPPRPARSSAPARPSVQAVRRDDGRPAGPAVRTAEDGSFRLGVAEGEVYDIEAGPPVEPSRPGPSGYVLPTDPARQVVREGVRAGSRGVVVRLP